MQTKQQLGIERGQCSFYRNVKVKENVMMHISEFVTQIRNGAWKNEVSSHRQLMSEGRHEEAGRVKNRLPAILVAGECEGGHTKANFRKFSGELVIDVDGCQGKARELLQLLKPQPWLRAGWISVSDDGFKVVVRVDAETPFEFEKQAYPQVAARVQELIGLPVDKQCKDLTRMCYVSWDEDAFWNGDCEVFPWREHLSDSLEPEELDVAKNPDSIEESSPSSVPKGKVSEAHGFIAHFFERFCRTHAFVPGSPNGVLLNVSELDTLRAAVNAEYGRFDDLMRACFHHETFGSDFKCDKRAYMVYSPKMAFCGSGTPSQFYRLCPSVENGAYSRYLIYLAEQDAEFQLMAPRSEKEDKDKVFKELGEVTYRMYRYLKAYPTEVSFTENQWNFHHSFFQSLLQGVKMEEVEGPVSVVFRHGMIAARLAMILTALRKVEAEWSFLDIACTDEDFMLALAVVEVLASHSLLFATSLHKIKSAPTEMRPYFRVRHALEKLKAPFTYTELISALQLEGFGMTTAKRYRGRLMDLGIIEKQDDSYCFAHRNWRAKLEKTSLGKV